MMEGIIIRNFILFFLLVFLPSEHMYTQAKSLPTNKNFFLPNSCGITVNAGPDITICSGQGKNLNGSVNGSTQYEWEPADGLSNPNILNPVATPSSTTTYTLTARAISGNKITNGAFETGNIAPSTSQYTPYTDVNSFVMSTGGYMVMSVPQIAAQFGCNPPIGAFTMAITPTGSGTNIWCQTIAVFANTDYKFDYKVFGIPYIFGSPPTIGLKVNGNLIGTVDAISGLCIEANGSFTWNSGAAVSATICFANYGGTGALSMCAIDDIVVRECCVEKDEVTVTVFELLADVLPPDEINCLNRPITIDASNSSQGPGISYMWSTKNGKIVSGDKTLTPSVDSPGVYTLKITGPFGCEEEIDVVVTGSVTPPKINTKNTNIDCLNSIASIEASSQSASPQFEWNGPNGYYSTRAINLNIKEPGEYIVKVTDAYGCENTAKVEVKDLRTFIEAEITGDSLSCSKDSAQLTASSLATKPKYNWTGPGGFKKDSSLKAVVSDTGWYYLLTTDSSGCKELDSFYVKNVAGNISLSLKSDTITCAHPEVQINTILDSTATVIWTGPNNFISSQKEPKISSEGWYYIEVITKDSCRKKDSIYIFRSADVPDIFSSGDDTINCDRPNVIISGGSNSPGSKIEWTTPSGIIMDQTQLTVQDSGTYTLTVTGQNGCKISKQLYIYKDLDSPVISVSNDTLNCLKDSLLLIFNSSNYRTVLWEGPGGFSSTDDFPIVRIPGQYKITLTGNNGCTATDSLNIVEDKNKPTLDLNSDTLNCINLSVSPMVSVSAGMLNYSWSGPNGFSSALKNISITEAGIYTLNVVGENGCSEIKSILIVQDTIRPSAQLSSDTISCKVKGMIRSFELKNYTGLFWTGPNGFNSSDSVNAVNEAGFYTLRLTGSNGCVFTDSVFVFQKDQLPNISVKDDTLSCLKNKLQLSGGSSTPGVTYEWTGPNGFNSTLQNPEVQDSGMYTLKVIDPLGCEVSGNVRIFSFTTPPILQLKLSRDSLTCRDSVINVKVNTSTQGTIQWSGPGGFNSMNDSLVLNEPGTFVVRFTDQFGCTASDSFNIKDRRLLPGFNLSDDTLSCKKISLNLGLTTADLNLNFNWSGPGNFSSTQKNPMITIAGTYVVKVSNPFDCSLTKSLNITADTIKPDLSISADTITCLRSIAPVKASSSLQGFTMRWTGPNGFTYTLPQFNTMIPGVYTCTITNPRNGCSTTANINIIEDTGRISSVLIKEINSSCNQNNGKLNVLQINGGKAPYLFSIDNGNQYTSDLSKLNLAPGVYSLLILDANGCIFTSTHTIIEEGQVQISINPQVNIKENEDYQLNVNVLSDPAKISSYLWQPSDQLSCSNCPNPVFNGDKDVLLTLTVTDENGCTASAGIQIVIQRETTIYFPNAFSPNGDNINDHFYPIGPASSLTKIALSIYDRWGNLQFNNPASGINQVKEGWNGSSRSGQKCNPGVYLFIAEWTENGTTKQISGNLTLVH